MKPSEGLDLDNPNEVTSVDGSVECLGKTFTNDAARREHYLQILAEKLKDPEFRKIEGFPIGEEEDILELSDPPYYTACPNPFLDDLADLYSSKGKSVTRNAIVENLGASRNNKFVNAHSYATKVPHEIVKTIIEYYTDAEDLVLDAFCGSGMAGVAAQMAGRRIILNDLGPAATYISNNMNSGCDQLQFQRDLKNISDSLEELSWLYQTKDDDGEMYPIVATLWSDALSCHECGAEIIYWDVALDYENSTTLGEFSCSSCGVKTTKNKSKNIFESYFDDLLNRQVSIGRRVPVLIVYRKNGKTLEKKPDEHDLEVISKAKEFEIETFVPIVEIPDGYNTSQPRKSHGITHLHHFFTRRNLIALSAAWKNAKSIKAKFVLTSLMYKSSILCSPLLSNYFAAKKGVSRGGWIGKERSGTLYCPSVQSEVSVSSQVRTRAKSANVFYDSQKRPFISTGSSSDLQLANEVIDFIFIDPPFGANKMYSELNFLWEAWLGVRTDNRKEAIENSSQGKTIFDYEALMLEAFNECYRVLKPGKWLVVEFSNTSNAIWNCLQNALRNSGFLIGGVITLDKKQGSILSLTTNVATKQDLVISAYKPDGGFQERFVEEKNVEGLWDFVRTHLRYLPIAKRDGDELSKIPERDPRILYDEVVAYFVRNARDVPVSSREFQEGLLERFTERDGMIFLPERVAEYDKARISSKQLKQLTIFIDDESSAIEWLRQLLNVKPQTYQGIHPKFVSELSGWKKAEETLELSKVLEQNFLKYDGIGPVPPQLHSHLSTNFNELRSLAKDDPQLVKKAKDRWYVPNPDREEDLQKLRDRDLLKQFAEYKDHSGRKLKTVRMEAVRCGFKKAWQDRDYGTIISVAEKIPQNLLQEDQKLLMWYDQAQTRSSDGALG
ncbi:DNA methyltransferase [Pseudomonadota bacterium]